MTELQVGPLGDEYGFGAQITGLTLAMLEDETVRSALGALFEDRGLLLFRDCEEDPRLQIEVSKVFGPLKVFPVGSVRRAEGNPMLVDLRQEEKDITRFEVGGATNAEYLPWHFDHCYLGFLNRGGVLRPVKIPEHGGQTGFLDGIDAYERLPAALRAKIEGKRVLYHAEYEFKLKFWRPEGFKVLHVSQYNLDVQQELSNTPRALHPAVFERLSDGRKVLHVSPWMAEGIEGHEDPEGNALLKSVMTAMVEEGNPYLHSWRRGDLIAWDNWRMMHMVTGHPADEPRQMHRTTIVGDYGAGGLEQPATEPVCEHAM